MSLDLGSESGRESTKGTKTQATTGVRTEQLQVDQAAISKIIEDVLGGTGGLADIFGGEQVAGIFDSTVVAEQSKDFVAKLAGELAKLTGKTVRTDDTFIEEEIDQRTASRSQNVNAGFDFSI